MEEKDTKLKVKKIIKESDKKLIKYSVIALVALLFISIFVIVLYRNETHMDRLVDKIYDKYRNNVDLATHTLYENGEFASSSAEEQRKAMGRLLDYYEKTNKIRSVYYDGIDYLYMFVYTDDVKYGNYGTAPLKAGEKSIDEVNLISSNEYKGKYLA